MRRLHSMNYTFRNRWSLALALAFVLFIVVPAHADPDVFPTLAPDKIAAQIAKTTPKTVVFVFDVTESTRSGGVFSNEREATSEILREGCKAGDRVVLLSFGTDYRTVFDETLGASPDFSALIGQIPGAPEPGHGTNIRYPHHAALKLIDAGLPRPGVIILLTDSFNDQPLPTDSTYPTYLQYYALDSLTHYPHTPANRDYERLLRKLMPSGQLQEYGVGVEIAKSGRPVERLPTTAAETDEGAMQATAPPPVHEKPTSDLPAIIGVAAVVLVALIAFGLSRATAPLPVRLSLGGKALPRDYRVRKGARIGLGGSLGSAVAGDDVFPINGVAEPAAYVKASGSRLELLPGKLEGVKVFHNGTRLEAAEPLHPGDEIRIALPATDTAAERDVRVSVRDPKEKIFS